MDTISIYFVYHNRYSVRRRERLNENLIRDMISINYRDNGFSGCKVGNDYWNEFHDENKDNSVNIDGIMVKVND